MYKIAIIEDEAPARKKLQLFLNKLHIDYTIVVELDTVFETQVFLQEAPDIDIIFSDIELRDGNVFEIYNRQKISVPIIFITAYNDFWMNAFDTNGIAYLLKPYPFERFENAWNKFVDLKETFVKQQQSIFKQLDCYFQQKTPKSYKETLAVRMATGIYFLKVVDICYLQADQGIVCAFDKKNKKYVLNENSLGTVQEQLDPNLFFRINRSELVHKTYIESIHRYSKNTIAIELYQNNTILKTSQSQTAPFKTWMGL